MRSDSPPPSWYEPRVLCETLDLDETDVMDEPTVLDEPLVICRGVVTWTLIDDNDD